jgi:transposase-like protein
MSITRRKFTSEFKMNVVLAAIKENQTLAELASKYEVHPNLIQQWKKVFLEKARGIFEEKGSSDSDRKEDETGKLYEQIGRLQIENTFLKKKLY